MEAIDDESFADEVLNYIRLLSSSISSKEMDSIFNEIRKKTVKNYEKAKTITDEFNKKLSSCLRSLAYFYFLESIDEYSVISDGIVEKIREKYQNNYLDIIAQIDKKYLSIDMKNKVNYGNDNKEIEDDLLKKYVVLKKWQDEQHYFFEGEYWNFIEQVHIEYLKTNNLSPFQLEQEVLKKRLFDKLRKRKLLDIEICSIISELYIKEDVVKLIGGKMYGLAVLNSKNIPIPYSVVVPTFTEIMQNDLTFLKQKYEYYSIRSSADIEDGKKNSFAGMFDSVLNVEYKKILEQIEYVKNSVNNERVKEYIKLNNLEKPNMAVIIQAFKEPQYAGVWIGNSLETGVLEWVHGNGEKLVSGTDTPYNEFWEKSAFSGDAIKVKGVTIGEKMLEYQKLIKCNSDFEWMILDGELIMLQFRPVTQNIYRIETKKREDEWIYGISASSGIVSGEAKYLESPDESLEKGQILLANITGTSWVPNIMKAKGAVTARGGFLCHTAIICRELGIPCVTGIGMSAIEKLLQYKEIELDGSIGRVKGKNK
ncbi:MAG: PEP/pyruvate-binding domain-containing protein [Clostridia bacterium]|nr:PEP/pyruvate-binding domain-containing protein [Clostridia bacterium]